MKKLSLLLILFLVVLCCSQASVSGQPEPERPNVLVILTDDQDVSSLRYMPRVQRDLVDQGVSFDNSLVTTATCCPSRASFFTGKYAHNHEIYRNFYPFGGERKFREQGTDRDTIATVMDAAGYRTGYMGKYLNEYEDRYVPPGWDGWWGYVGGYAKNPNGLPDSKYQINTNGSFKTYEHERLHETDYFAQKSESFVRNGGEDPWFLVVAPNSPHEPSYVAKRHRNLFAKTPLPRSGSFNERDVSDKPVFIRTQKPISGAERREILNNYRKRLRSLQPTDEMISRLVQALRETGQLENTYIIYASDNGYHFGEHRIRKGKGGPYEESIKVPLIIRGPGIPQGETKEELVANIDWAPTIAEWSGSGMSAPDGRSLDPILRSQDGPWRDSLLVELPREGRDRRGFSALRTNDEMFVEYQNGFREYYDLTRDPGELDNTYRSLDSSKRSDLKTRLENLKSCADETCRNR